MISSLADFVKKREKTQTEIKRPSVMNVIEFIVEFNMLLSSCHDVQFDRYRKWDVQVDIDRVLSNTLAAKRKN